MRRPGNKKKENMKKIVGTLAGIGLAVLFFMLLTFYGKTAPENPMKNGEADASHMYLTSSTLAMDKEKLASVENANISSGDSENQAEEEQQEEEQQEEEEQEQEEQEQQEEQQEEQQQEEQQEASNPEQTVMDTVQTTLPDSLMNLIQKNEITDTGKNDPTQPGDGDGPSDQPGENTGNGNSGGIPSDGGQQSTLNPSQSEALFTTSFQDGEEVTEQEYPFSITLTEKGKQLTLVSMNVNLNGSSRICKNHDSLTLKEGANSVYVTVRFRDGKYN